MTAEDPKILKELKLVYKRVEELEARVEGLLAEQAALNAEIEKYHGAFEYAGDSIFILDQTETHILDANSNAARRLGYSRDELLAQNFKDIEVSPDDPAGWESAVSSTLVYESYLRHKDGSLIPVEVSSRPVILDGKQSLQKAIRDISRRRAAEEEREQLITDLDAFSHTVAHDLKGSLAIMSGFAQELALRATTDQQRQYSDMIVGHTAKMHEIIEGLMLLSRVRMQQDWRVDSLDMESIVAEALQRVAHRIEEFEPEISLPDEWPVALGYAPWVEEVWMNYLSNAIKYGGQPPLVRLGAESVEGYVRFWISDNGPGLSSEEQSQLFAPFLRLGSQKPDKGMGHGLGLSIVRRIVEKLNGQAGVESAPGEGSTFWFTLPVQD